MDNHDFEEHIKETVNRSLNTLFAKNEYGITIPDQEYSLPGLFKRYFKGLCDGIFTAGDLRRLTEIIVKDNIDFPIKPMDIRVKVRKGLYEKLPYLYAEVLNGNKKQILIGASRPDCAIYFLFTNDKSDVNNGTIFVRESSASALKFKNTFEVNPFVRGRGIVTDPETGATEVKDQLTFNPTWLTHTVKNMDAYVFAPLVYVPPKPVMPRRKKGAATGEVDINAMVEKTLAKVKPTEVEAEKMAEEVRTGIDAYRDKALAEIAKRDGTEPSEGPVCETLFETEVTDPELNPVLAAMAGRND